MTTTTTKFHPTCEAKTKNLVIERRALYETEGSRNFGCSSGGCRNGFRPVRLRRDRLRPHQLSQCAAALFPATTAADSTQKQLRPTRSPIQLCPLDGKKHPEHARPLPGSLLAMEEHLRPGCLRQHGNLGKWHQLGGVPDYKHRLSASDDATASVRPSDHDGNDATRT